MKVMNNPLISLYGHAVIAVRTLSNSHSSATVLKVYHDGESYC